MLPSVLGTSALKVGVAYHEENNGTDGQGLASGALRTLKVNGRSALSDPKGLLTVDGVNNQISVVEAGLYDVVVAVMLENTTTNYRLEEVLAWDANVGAQIDVPIEGYYFEFAIWNGTWWNVRYYYRYTTWLDGSEKIEHQLKVESTLNAAKATAGGSRKERYHVYRFSQIVKG